METGLCDVSTQQPVNRPQRPLKPFECVIFQPIEFALMSHIPPYLFIYLNLTTETVYRPYLLARPCCIVGNLSSLAPVSFVCVTCVIWLMTEIKSQKRTVLINDELSWLCLKKLWVHAWKKEKMLSCSNLINSLRRLLISWWDDHDLWSTTAWMTLLLVVSWSFI